MHILNICNVVIKKLKKIFQENSIILRKVCRPVVLGYSSFSVDYFGLHNMYQVENIMHFALQYKL